LNGADFSGANLGGADFTRADMRKANLKRAYLKQNNKTAKFNDANLEGAIWINGTICKSGSYGKCLQ
jgi:uncharacterized protein YjbI with pentapeptide repeats